MEITVTGESITRSKEAGEDGNVEKTEILQDGEGQRRIDGGKSSSGLDLILLRTHSVCVLVLSG